MTQRERTLEELLSALSRLIEQHAAKVRGTIFDLEAVREYQTLRRRIAKELGRRPN